MKKFLKVLLLPLLAINLLGAICLICCAYSPLLPVESMPLLSLTGLGFPFVLTINVVFLILWLLIYPSYAMVSLVTCLICISQIHALIPINLGKRQSPKSSLKVLSYNILRSNVTEKNIDKGNEVISYLDEADADIICLQEFRFSALKKHKKLLKKYPYRSYQLSKDSESASRYLCCLSKHPILSVEKIPFKKSFNGCYKYKILHESDTIVVYNCHLQTTGLKGEDRETYEQMLSNPKESISNEGTKNLIRKLCKSAIKRADQIDVVMSDLKRETSPYIVLCGDFNDSPISYAHHQARKVLDDAYISSGNGLGISYNHNKMYYRIDHILYSPQFKSYKCTVDHSIKVSDHYPIYCFLKKK